MLDLQVKGRADERTRTAYPCSLRVIGHVLQGVAQACKCRISKLLSLLWVAACCTVLRSRWYQCGIRRTGKFDLRHQSTEFTMPAQRISATPMSLSPVLTVMEVRTIPDSVAWPSGPKLLIKTETQPP